MALNDELKKLINELAQVIITIYKIKIPITDIDEVVKKIGGEIREDPALNNFSSGKIRKKGPDSFEITVSPYQTQERRNFTIAHELGHLFLHMGFQSNQDIWNEQNNISYYRSGSSEQEYQSNEFAAAFLMPQNEYKKILDENTKGNLVNTSEIANYFHVSIDAAANRGKWLGYLEW